MEEGRRKRECQCRATRGAEKKEVRNEEGARGKRRAREREKASSNLLDTREELFVRSRSSIHPPIYPRHAIRRSLFVSRSKDAALRDTQERDRARRGRREGGGTEESLVCM